LVGKFRKPIEKSFEISGLKALLNPIWVIFYNDVRPKGPIVFVLISVYIEIRPNGPMILILANVLHELKGL
jgi:hypothetical protein